MENNTLVMYTIELNGKLEHTYFADHMEASLFFDECDRYNDTVIVYNYKEVTTEDILADNSISYADKVEYIAMLNLPNHAKFKKVDILEEELKKLHIL